MIIDEQVLLELRKERDALAARLEEAERALHKIGGFGADVAYTAHELSGWARDYFYQRAADSAEPRESDTP